MNIRRLTIWQIDNIVGTTGKNIHYALLYLRIVCVYIVSLLYIYIKRKRERERVHYTLVDSKRYRAPVTGWHLGEPNAISPHCRRTIKIYTNNNNDNSNNNENGKKIPSQNSIHEEFSNSASNTLCVHVRCIYIYYIYIVFTTRVLSSRAERECVRRIYNEIFIELHAGRKNRTTRVINGESYIHTS